MRHAAVWCAVLVAALAIGGPVLAHRVNVFAYVEGDTVIVECSYSKSDRVRSGELEVQNAATGTVYLTGKTDDKGHFAFPVPPEARAAKADLRIVLRAGEGHLNDTLVTAGEYQAAAPASPAPAAAASSPSLAASGPVVAAPRPSLAAAVASAPCDPAVVQAVVEAAVEKKIAPLRKILVEEKEKGPGMTEIAGGIGYLVGIAGLLAYARSRKGSSGA